VDGDQDNPGLDFTITPRTTGRVISSDGFVVEGLEIQDDFGTLAVTNSQGYFAFNTVIGPAGYSVDIQIGNLGPFLYTTPEDATIAFGDGDDYVQFDLDHRSLEDWQWVTYSWDEPGGAGYSYWISTPGNTFPNNPNFHVEADFMFTYLNGGISHDRIRLVAEPQGILPAEGILSSVDLNWANGFLAEFDIPLAMTECGLGNLEVQVGFDLANGGVRWLPLNDGFPTGISDLDLYPDGVVNLSDLVIFSGALNTRLGDENWVPCANFWPDEVINLSDVVLFSTYYFARNKQMADRGTPGSSASLRTEERGTELTLSSKSGWNAAVVRIETDSPDQPTLEWIPEPEFVDKSVLVPENDGGYALFLFNADAGHLITPGFLVSPGETKEISWRVVSVSTVAQEDLDPIMLSRDQAPEVSGPEFQAAPNPFNPQTVLKFNQIKDGPVTLQVFDSAGRLVRTLVNEDQSSGPHEVVWNGKDDAGRRTATGIYFARLVQDEGTRVQKLVMLK
jgi:hypothetical protein